MATRIYVGNLSFSTSHQELSNLFATIGPVRSATVIEDRETGRSRGFAFVEMDSASDGANAIEQLNGVELGGRQLKVNEAKAREDRGPIGGNRYGSDYARGGSYGGARSSDFGGRSW